MGKFDYIDMKKYKDYLEMRKYGLIRHEKIRSTYYLLKYVNIRSST